MFGRTDQRVSSVKKQKREEAGKKRKQKKRFKKGEVEKRREKGEREGYVSRLKGGPGVLFIHTVMRSHYCISCSQVEEEGRVRK